MSNFTDLIEIFKVKGDIDSFSVQKFVSFLSDENTSKIELAALTAAWKAKGEKASELACIAEFILSQLERIEMPFDVIDCCGTGGDNSGSFNISTASAILAASLGAKVAKHGGRKTTSNSGSIDFAEALGVPTFSLKAEIENAVNEHGIALISSPALHQVLGNWKRMCKKMEFAGQTGLIGTLTNPVKLTHQIIGVAKPEWGQMMIESLKGLGRKRAAVVHGEPKIDEISVCGKTKIWLLDNDSISHFELDPKNLGFEKYYSLSELRGGEPQENANLFLDLLKPENQSSEAIVAAILLNTAFLLWIYGTTSSIESGLELARESLNSGKAMNFLRKLSARII